MGGLNFYIISHFFTAAVAAALGLIVILKDVKRAVYRAYGLLTLGVFIWSFSYAFWLIAEDYESALFWSRLLNFGATLIPVFYLHWIIRLLKKNEKRLLVLFYFLSYIFAVLSFSDFYISGTKEILQFPYWPQAGWLYIYFLISGWCLAIGYGIYLLVKELKQATGYYREQIRYVIWGSLVGFIGGSTNFPLMMGLDWFPALGSPLVVAYPIIFGYTMVRHRLMDIKFVLRGSFVYISTLCAIMLMVVSIEYVFSLYFASLSTWAEVIVLILALLSFNKVKKYFYNIANKYFFSSLYDSRQVISEFSDNLRSTLELENIYHFISNTLFSIFHTLGVGILLFNEKRQNYQIVYNKGFKSSQSKQFARDRRLYDIFIKHNKPIIIEELSKLNNSDSKATVDLLKEFKVAVLSPLKIKNKTIGLIAISNKESGDMYNEEDLQVLEVICAQSAIALENALLYEESQQFGQKLKKEVERATVDLRHANARLKELDQAKTEFISIASHQLRTPLSAIKGYLSMVLEGDFGPVSSKLNKIVKDVFQSNERLVRLVNVFLNVSRIESGRLKVAKTDFDLVAWAGKSINDMISEAERKGLKLEFVKKKDKIMVNADQDKIMDILINFIDNAIKYSQKGKITVTVEKREDSARVTVKDNGIGIGPEEIKELFTKFTRGRKVSQISTSGSGLGLFIAKKIVELHKGKIWAESKGEGKGSSFIFEIPVK